MLWCLVLVITPINAAIKGFIVIIKDIVQGYLNEVLL